MIGGREKRVAGWWIFGILRSRRQTRTTEGMAGTRITESGYSERPAHGRAFRIAMSVLAGIVSVQLVAIVHGVLRRGPESGSPAPIPMAAPVEARPDALPAEVPSPASGAGEEAVSSGPEPVPGRGMAPVALSEGSAPGPGEQVVDDPGGPSFVGPADAGGGSAGPLPLYAALEAAARNQPLADVILERLLVAGVELRGKGNTQGALKNFREVESALPEDPRVLSEIAATLGKMGLRDRATGYWERVEALGEIGAGAYFPIAARELRGEAVPVSPELPLSAEEEPKPMKIGEVKVVEQAPTSEGQKVSLSVVIDADPTLLPIADDLSLIVNFYDRLPGGEVKPSTAETSYLYPTEPYDWQIDGTETIVVNYHQPAFTEEERRSLGERTFYGYAIELHYRDELQDKVTMPEDIAELRFEPAPATAAPTAEEAGPENALFPTSVQP